MKFKIEEDIKIVDSKINKLYGNFLQTPSWGKLKQYEGWDPLNIVFTSKGDVVGYTLALVRKQSFFKLMYVPRGPIVKDMKYFKEAVDMLVIISKMQNCSMLKIEPDLEYKKDYLDFLKNFTISQKPIQPLETGMLNLRLTEEELIKNIESKKRVRVRNKFNLEFKREDENIEGFYSIHKKTSEIQNFKTRGIEYFKRMQDIFKESTRIYSVYKDNKLIASSFNIIYKDTITYLYSGSNKEYNNMYPGYHLVFQTALASKKEGLLYFDLWGVGNQEKWKGFSDFKINLAPTMKRYLGSFDLPLNKSHYFIFKLLSKR